MLKDCGMIFLTILLIISMWRFDIALFKFLGIIAIILIFILLLI